MVRAGGSSRSPEGRSSFQRSGREGSSVSGRPVGRGRDAILALSESWSKPRPVPPPAPRVRPGGGRWRRAATPLEPVGTHFLKRLLWAALHRVCESVSSVKPPAVLRPSAYHLSPKPNKTGRSPRPHRHWFAEALSEASCRTPPTTPPMIATAPLSWQRSAPPPTISAAYLCPHRAEAPARPAVSAGPCHSPDTEHDTRFVLENRCRLQESSRTHPAPALCSPQGWPFRSACGDRI